MLLNNQWITEEIKEEIRTQTCTKGRPCEDTGRRWPSTGNGERSQKKPDVLLTP